MRGQLQMVLENILRRPERFDHIIVETTGLVNPGPVASQFWVDDAFESKYYLDAIITVVDAKNLLRHLDDKSRADNVVNEAERQIGMLCALFSHLRSA
jgi:G3E family GTPase